MTISPPDVKGKTYEQFHLELEAWGEVPYLAKAKQGIVVALSLPEGSGTGIRDKVFDEFSIADLKKDDGLDTLIKFMGTKLKKDDLAGSWEKFDDFEEYKRGKGPSVSDFISKFDQRYDRIAKKNMTLSPEISPFKLLKCVNLSKEE